ncbi:MAG: S41 family peptidase [Bacteroidaceae bacterium]|nr:S41 family peptidase [Bacteroidaceae bacterium]
MKRKIFTLLLIVATLPSIVVKADEKHKFQLSRQISIINSIIKDLNLFYVDSIMPEILINKSIDAMLSNLDPYTLYYPANKADELKMMTTGKYAGIGSVIRFHTDKKTTVLSEPYEGMPAQKAGLKAGDVIISIDGIDVKGMSTDSVSDKLRGEAGTALTIEYERPGKKGTSKVKLQRESIALPAIPYYGLQKDNVGYIQLNSFTDGCAKDMRRAIIDLKKQGATAFIIDLRSNGGGLLNEAVDIVNLFVPKDKIIVTTKGKIKQSNEVYKTQKAPIDTTSPIAILVDGQTASASEIVAGALQDLDRAVIIGSRTFGKGLVQSTREVTGGGYLKITTAKYYTPSGRCVQALDYSHVIDQGKTSRIPDSLTNVFYTEAGREVRDGGGVRPDIEPKSEELSTLLFYLMQDIAVFDYATEYAIKNSTIAPADTFELSDEDYEEFKRLLKSRNFSYDLISVKVLKDLKQAVEFEGFSGIVKEEIESLERKLQTNLDHSLTHFEKEIRKIIADEIIHRYYGQKGRIIYNLREDTDIEEAFKILKNEKEYRNILSPTKK